MSVLGFAVLKGRPDYDGVMTGTMLMTMPKCRIVCAGMRCVGLLGHDGAWQSAWHVCAWGFACLYFAAFPVVAAASRRA